VARPFPRLFLKAKFENHAQPGWWCPVKIRAAASIGLRELCAFSRSK